MRRSFLVCVAATFAFGPFVAVLSPSFGAAGSAWITYSDECSSINKTYADDEADVRAHPDTYNRGDPNGVQKAIDILEKNRRDALDAAKARYDQNLADEQAEEAKELQAKRDQMNQEAQRHYAEQKAANDAWAARMAAQNKAQADKSSAKAQQQTANQSANDKSETGKTRVARGANGSSRTRQSDSHGDNSLPNSDPDKGDNHAQQTVSPDVDPEQRAQELAQQRAEAERQGRQQLDQVLGGAASTASGSTTPNNFNKFDAPSGSATPTKDMNRFDSPSTSNGAGGRVTDTSSGSSASNMNRFDAPSKQESSDDGGVRWSDVQSNGAFSADQRLHVETDENNWINAGSPQPSAPLEQLVHSDPGASNPKLSEGLTGKQVGELSAALDDVFKQVGVTPPSANDKNWADVAKDVVPPLTLPSLTGAALEKAELGPLAVAASAVEAMTNIASDKNVSMDRLKAMQTSCDSAIQKIGALEDSQNQTAKNISYGIGASASSGTLTLSDYVKAADLLTQHSNAASDYYFQIQKIRTVKMLIENRIKQKQDDSVPLK